MPSANDVPERANLAQYSFEARQLHIPYFVCLAIMCRPGPGNSYSPGFLLASSFIAGIFEDFLARDEIQFLGPIFTFHLLAAGIGLLSSYTVPSLWERATESLQTIYLSLDVLAAKWSSAKGSLRALRSIAEKQQSVAETENIDPQPISREHSPFFNNFGPELSWAWDFFIETRPSHESCTITQAEPAIGSLQDVSLQTFTEYRPADTVASASSGTDQHRPLTTILDPHMGFTMADTGRSIDDQFFHNQYQGMGDWLLKDIDWNGDISW